MEKKENKYGTDFLEHLAILFIALKLCGVIDWSWWLVLCPLWIGVVLFISLSLVIFVIMRRK